jgi:endoglucanase
MKKPKILRMVVGCAVVLFLIHIARNTMAGDRPVEDYKKALRIAVQFYDANRCGKNVANDNAFAWRKKCHTLDGKDVGLDLTGGFHDAGDHVKFGLPQGYAAAILGWSYYEYKDAFRTADSDKKILSTMRLFAEYFMKAAARKGKFYYQIGDGGADHSYWGSPEKQDEDRPTRRFADAEHPASDVLGETAAALALCSINFRESDAKFAGRCLVTARELYSMGKKTQGVGDGQSFYQSSSYLDDLAWGAVWLHIATKEKSYLEDVDAYIKESVVKKQNPFLSQSTMNWDDVFIGVMLKMGEITGEKKYFEAIEHNLDFWMKTLKTTKGGLKYFSQWGVLRYTASASMIANLYASKSGKITYRDFARSQIDYILGSNPAGMSYLIGFGKIYPKDPHHRASVSCRYDSGRKESDCELIGALVGGPDEDDQYSDNMDMYQFSEVAIDYNAGLVGALAGFVKK